MMLKKWRLFHLCCIHTLNYIQGRSKADRKRVFAVCGTDIRGYTSCIASLNFKSIKHSRVSCLMTSKNQQNYKILRSWVNYHKTQKGKSNKIMVSVRPARQYYAHV